MKTFSKKTANAEIRKTNENGFYPSNCGCGKTKIDLNYHLKGLLVSLNASNSDATVHKIFRQHVNSIFGYLEQIEGYHFGVSERYIFLKPLKDTLEHKIPMKIMRKMMIEQNFSENDLDAVLNFVREHYCSCLLTKEEDSFLSAKKIRQCNGPDGMDRYEYAGIRLSVNPGK